MKDVKIILILGPGDGAGFVSDLIEDHYIKNSIPHKKFSIGSRSQYPDLIKKITGFKGFVIVKTNLFIEVDEWSTWQRIFVTGDYYGCSSLDLYQSEAVQIVNNGSEDL